MVTLGTRTYLNESAATTLVLPASSLASAVIAFVPGVNVTRQSTCVPATVAGTSLHVTPATPESASATIPLMTASEVNSVLPLAGDVIVKLGGVLSMLTVTLAVAVFPALSMATPLTTWCAASAVSDSSAGHTATPEVASEHVNVTTTSVLFHPLSFGLGSATAVIVGGSLSVPMISTEIVPPGLPRSSTASSFVVRTAIGLSISVTF